ncbi:MAG: hypothetical protein R3E08_00475 [Thiotrichaceae bacterium]
MSRRIRGQWTGCGSVSIQAKQVQLAGMATSGNGSSILSNTQGTTEKTQAWEER